MGPGTWPVRRDREDAGSQHAPPMLIPRTGSILVSVTKVPYGPRETGISRDR
jgi:hypothetical protein